MEYTVKLEISEDDINEAMWFNDMTREEVLTRINNTIYMGLSCIDAMVHRDLGVDGFESYVEGK